MTLTTMDFAVVEKGKSDMDREQIIEQMEKCVCKDCTTEMCASGRCSRLWECPLNIQTIEALYEAGYRKQSEGCEFCKEEKCGNCVVFVCERTDDRCCTTPDCEPCVEYRPIKYCPNCGAKMKGAEDAEQ